MSLAEALIKAVGSTTQAALSAKYQHQAQQQAQAQRGGRRRVKKVKKGACKPCEARGNLMDIREKWLPK